MRLYGSIRLQFFKAFAPRIGVISGPIGRHYNAHAIDSTTLLPEHHPVAGFVALLVLLFLTHPGR